MAVLLAALFLLLPTPHSFSQGKVELVHPGFRLTLGGLKSAVSSLPVEVREKILADPKGFLELLSSVLDEPQDLFILVDKANALSKDCVPPDLVPLSEYPLTLTKSGLVLRKVLIPDLLAMEKAARRDGVTLCLSSTYRSYGYQVTLYENALKTQSKEEVEKELAPPGHSQHQLGTVIDFGSIDASFAATMAGKWLTAKAWKYGFSLSYPEGKEPETGYTYEPWHYRYVGRSAASLIQEFFGGSQQRFLVFYREKRGFFRDARK